MRMNVPTPMSSFPSFFFAVSGNGFYSRSSNAIYNTLLVDLEVPLLDLPKRTGPEGNGLEIPLHTKEMDRRPCRSVYALMKFCNSTNFQSSYSSLINRQY